MFVLTAGERYDGWQKSSNAAVCVVVYESEAEAAAPPAAAVAVAAAASVKMPFGEPISALNYNINHAENQSRSS